MLLWWQRDAWFYMVSTQQSSTMFKSTNNGSRGLTTQCVNWTSPRNDFKFDQVRQSGELFGLINTTYSIGAILSGWFIAGPTVASTALIYLRQDLIASIGRLPWEKMGDGNWMFHYDYCFVRPGVCSIPQSWRFYFWPYFDRYRPRDCPEYV